MRRTIAIPDPLATVLCPFGHSIICASNKVVLIDPETTSQNQSFGASSGRIHSVLTSTVSSSHPDLFLTAAESDRFINVFDAEKKDSIGSLVAESDVLSLTLSPSDDNLIFTKDIASNQTSELQILAAINRDGALEFFESPFVFSASLPQGQSESLKARFKRRTRKSTAQVRIIASDGSNNVLPIIAASFQGNDCILAWAGGGVKMLFHRIPWRNEGTGEALLSGEVEVIKPNPIAISDISTSTGAIDGKRGRVDESRTIVADADDLDTTGVGAQEPTVINISSDEDESNDEDAEFLAEPESRQPSIRSSSLDPRHRKAEGSVSDGDVEMNDAEANGLDEAPEPEESNEQSFGELVKAYAPEPVDIQASISTSHQQISASRREEKPQLTSGMSLSTVLTQSLRTNDISLLETCLHMKDLTVVRATIERLDSSLASSLLRKLAERLHSRPGRAGGLMVWIQWTIVAHGGYLASQRDIMKDLESLHRVVGHRASSLPFLLSLKGKLDMLEAQMNLRKSMQTRAIKANALDDDNEEGVIYIEGEAESNSGSESGNEEALDVVSEREYDAPDDRDFNEHTGAEAPLRNKKLKSQAPRTANGIVNDSGDDESPSGEEESSGEEASSTDDESTNEETEEMDLDSVESDVSSGPEEAPAMKRAATSKLVNGLSSGKGQM